MSGGASFTPRAPPRAAACARLAPQATFDAIRASALGRDLALAGLASGGHRHGTHSFVGIAVFSAGALAAGPYQLTRT